MKASKYSVAEAWKAFRAEIEPQVAAAREPAGNTLTVALARQGKAAGVAVFVKQLGAFCIEEHGSQRKRILHDHSKAGDPAEWPEDLRVQEWPEGT